LIHSVNELTDCRLFSIVVLVRLFLQVSIYYCKT